MILPGMKLLKASDILTFCKVKVNTENQLIYYFYLYN